MTVNEDKRLISILSNCWDCPTPFSTSNSILVPLGQSQNFIRTHTFARRSTQELGPKCIVLFNNWTYIDFSISIRCLDSEISVHLNLALYLHIYLQTHLLLFNPLRMFLSSLKLEQYWSQLRACVSGESNILRCRLVEEQPCQQLPSLTAACIFTLWCLH